MKRVKWDRNLVVNKNRACFLNVVLHRGVLRTARASLILAKGLMKNAKMCEVFVRLRRGGGEAEGGRGSRVAVPRDDNKSTLYSWARPACDLSGQFAEQR